MHVVNRLMRYEYPDAETALEDMSRWAVQTIRTFGDTVVKSATIGPAFEPTAEVHEPEGAGRPASEKWALEYARLLVANYMGERNEPHLARAFENLNRRAKAEAYLAKADETE